MRAHRLQRLKLLTQGAALLGLGASEAACHDPPDSVHINAPYVQPDAGPPTPTVVPTQMNAPFVVDDAGAPPTPPTPPASASAGAVGSAKPPAAIATGSAPSGAPSGKPPWMLPHMNATATPPKHVNSPPKE